MSIFDWFSLGILGLSHIVALIWAVATIKATTFAAIQQLTKTLERLQISFDKAGDTIHDHGERISFLEGKMK